VAPTLHGARVLEVGCGDGRLTRRYADRASRVLAIDSDPEHVATACSRLSGPDNGHVTFLATPVADLDPRSGLFAIDAERTFTFSHHAPSLEALRAHLAATWTDAVIQPSVADRVESLMAAGGESTEVVLQETAWMRLLRKNSAEAATGCSVDGKVRPCSTR
jgi:predicted RNA methylase